MRDIISGSEFLAFLEEGEPGGETYRPIAGQTNCSLTRGPNYRENNIKNLGGFKDFQRAMREWTATIDMDVAEAGTTGQGEVTFEELQNLERTGIKARFFFCWIDELEDGTLVPDKSRFYRGRGLVSCPKNTPTGENTTTSITIQGCTELFRLGSKLNLLWTLFSNTEDGEQVYFVSNAEDGEQVIFEINQEDRT